MKTNTRCRFEISGMCRRVWTSNITTSEWTGHGRVYVNRHRSFASLKDLVDHYRSETCSLFSIVGILPLNIIFPGIRVPIFCYYASACAVKLTWHRDNINSWCDWLTDSRHGKFGENFDRSRHVWQSDICVGMRSIVWLRWTSLIRWTTCNVICIQFSLICSLSKTWCMTLKDDD